MESILTLAFLRNYFVSLIIFLAIDFVWLAFIAKTLYSKHLGYLMTPNVNFVAAFVFYLIFILGLMYFVVNPALNAGSWTLALLSGMFFGFVTYATYDLTNLSTVRDWPLVITIIDLIWGSFLSGMTSLFSYLAIKSFF